MSPADTFLQLLRDRRSIRTYRKAPVPKELLLQLIESAAWAPSASNRQDWSFTVVTSPQLIAEMAAAVAQRWQAIVDANKDFGGIEDLAKYTSHFGWFATTPAVVAVSAMEVDSLRRHLLGDLADTTVGSLTSAAMAAQNLMLAARALGLGTCCMTGALAAEDKLKELLQLNERRRLVCLVTVGYPAEEPQPPARKPLDKIARFLE